MTRGKSVELQKNSMGLKAHHCGYGPAYYWNNGREHIDVK